MKHKPMLLRIPPDLPAGPASEKLDHHPEKTPGFSTLPCVLMEFSVNKSTHKSRDRT